MSGRDDAPSESLRLADSELPTNEAVADFVAAKSSAVDWKLTVGSGKLAVSFKEFACWRPEPPGFAVSVHA